MFKNNINPISLFGMIVLTPCAFLGAIFMEEFGWRHRGSIEYWHCALFAIMLMGLVSGIGLMLRKRFARVFTTLLISLATIAFSFFIVYLQMIARNRYEFMGVVVIMVVYVIFAFGILFINSNFLDPFFDKKMLLNKDDYDDILDQ